MSIITYRGRIAASLLPLIAAGSLMTAGARADVIEPQYYAGNPSCADLNPAWTELKIEGPTAGETIADDSTAKATITVNEATDQFDWTATVGIDAVIVKGGDNANVYKYDPEAMSGSGLHAPLNGEEETPKFFGLSHISFCYDTGDTPGDGGETPGGDHPGGDDTPAGDPTPPATTEPPAPTTAPAPEAPPATTPPVTGPILKPMIDILGDDAESGRSKMSGSSGCVDTTARATVSGRQIETVTFYLDGKKVKRMTAKVAQTKFRFSTRMASLKTGVHRITARVTFTRPSATKPRTHRIAFQRCAKASVKPTFAG